MTGGSLGARTLNESMLKMLPVLMENNIQVIWQTGAFYLDEMKERVSDLNITGVYMTDFLREMAEAYLIADLVVARAGALSIAELEITGKAAILIPSPNVAEDHQTKNAKALSERGAAEMIADHEAVEKLPLVVKQLLEDEEGINRLKANISAMAHPRAAEQIAREIIDMIE
jgi:UDP-N-acetylglucosamine--N-acetylmuramyl-(pentapeptide) pyrophosphoryl-undecaprenol N-acetylglucosamine transferase